MNLMAIDQAGSWLQVLVTWVWLYVVLGPYWSDWYCVFFCWRTVSHVCSRVLLEICTALSHLAMKKIRILKQMNESHLWISANDIRKKMDDFPTEHSLTSPTNSSGSSDSPSPEPTMPTGCPANMKHLQYLSLCLCGSRKVSTYDKDLSLWLSLESFFSCFQAEKK